MSLCLCRFSMMPANLLHLSVLLVLLLTLCEGVSVGESVAEHILEVKTVLGADAILKCTASLKAGVKYRAVYWYRVGEPPSPRLSGLLTHDLPNGTTRWYLNVDQEVELLHDSLDVLLPNVTCSDNGVYMCRLAAPVGEQNREGRVLLSVTDCSVSSSDSLVTQGCLVFFAVGVLMAALVIYLISYKCLRNVLRDRSKIKEKVISLNASLQPLQKKDLMLIYTLGPKTSTPKHIFV